MKKIRLRDNRICLFTHYSDRDKAVTLPGRRWRKSEKCWHCPATPAVWAQVKARWPEDCQEAVQEDDGIARLDDLLAKRRAVQQRSPAEEPDYPFHLPPRKHQIEATRFARDMDAALLDCWMGAGKTKMAIDACMARGSSTILVVCPAGVIDVWEDETRKHAPDVFEFHPLSGDRAGSVPERAAAMEEAIRNHEKPVMFAINYEAIWRDPIDDVILNHTWDTLIFDECHRIKGAGTKQSKFAKKIPREHVLGLTGTPMPHSPLDVYGQYRTFDVGIFGSRYSRFRDRYAVMGGYEGKQILGFQNKDELRNKMDRLRWHIPEDALDMPEVQVIDRTAKLRGKGKRLYESMDNALIAEVEEGTVTAANALSKLLRLQQITSGYLPVEKGPEAPEWDSLNFSDLERLLDGPEDSVEVENVDVSDAKQKLLAELLEDLYPQNAVVFARFRHDLDRIQEAGESADYNTMEISGRQRDYRAWKQAEDPTVIGVQIQAGQEGIDLTSSRYAIFYSMGFSLGNYQQAVARVHRPAQEEDSVTVYRLILKGTIDRKVATALDQRKMVIDEILSDWKGALNEQ